MNRYVLKEKPEVEIILQNIFFHVLGVASSHVHKENNPFSHVGMEKYSIVIFKSTYYNISV